MITAKPSQDKGMASKAHMVMAAAALCYDGPFTK